MAWQDLLTEPGRPGVFGALLDENARAADDFCRVLASFDDARFSAERPGDDANTRSPRAIALHVWAAGHRYADYILKARGMPHVERFEGDPALLARPADARARMREVFVHTERAVAGLQGTLEENRALSFTVRWGPTYDPEMLLEHAICHCLRHRRQLERW